jgi:hypothetical protein
MLISFSINFDRETGQSEERDMRQVGKHPKISCNKKLGIYGGTDTTFSDGDTFKRARQALNRELFRERLSSRLFTS